MELSTIIVGIFGVIGAAIGGAGTYAAVKFGLRNQISAHGEKISDIEDKIKDINKGREVTREFIVRLEEREKSREKHETQLAESLTASLAITEKIAKGFGELATGITEYLKIDRTLEKKDIETLKREVEHICTQMGNGAHIKK